MKNKQAISLIVLVITIIVMVILAGAIILTINNSGIINKSREAVFKQNVKNYQSELSLYLADRLAEDAKFDVATVDATGTDVQNVISSMKAEDTAEFKVEDGKLVYIGIDDSKIAWAEDLGLEIDTRELTQAEYEEKYATEIATALEVGQITNGSYSLKQEYINLGYEAEVTPSYKIALPYGVEDVNIYQAFVISDIIFPTTVKTITAISDVSITELNLPNGLEKISQQAIYGSSLKEVIIPDTVTTIEAFGLNNMYLTKLKLPKSLLKLDAAIVGNVNEMVIPENVVEIGSFAFMGMKVEKIYIESTKITTVGDDLFDNDPLTSGRTIYVRNAEIAQLFEGKYDPAVTTISTDYNWVAPE